MTQQSIIETESVSCVICNAKTKKKVFSGSDRLVGKEGRFTVEKCLKCGLHYTNPRPTKQSLNYYYPNEYTPYHILDADRPRVLNLKSTFLARIKNQIKAKILKKYYGYPTTSFEYINLKETNGEKIIHLLIQPLIGLLSYRFKKQYYRIPFWKNKGKALDFGCGRGEYLKLLKNLGWQVEGFDISDHVNDPDILIHLSDFAKLSMDNKATYDLITLWHSLEHVHDPVETVKSCYHSLKPGGYLYIEVPNCKSIVRHIFGKDWFAWDLPRHLYHFSRAPLIKILRKSGFVLKTIHYLPRTNIFPSIRYFQESHTWSPQHNVQKKKIAEFLIKWIARILALFRNSDTIFICAQKPNH